MDARGSGFWRKGGLKTAMIRRCESADFEDIYGVINDAAQAYRGVIPADCYGEPYMPREELGSEIAAGVAFWGIEQEGELASVMGLQQVGEVALIRHAYTRTARRNTGFGTALLARMQGEARRPLLVGTWKAALWAIRFYERRGFRLVPQEEKRALLHRYWTVPERQIEASVVLADEAWLVGRGRQP